MSERVNDVFVGNLTFATTEEQLREKFSFVGPVKGIRILTDKETGKPKGFAFVEYFDTNAALSAIRHLDQTELNGRKVKVGFPNTGHLKDVARQLGQIVPEDEEKAGEVDINKLYGAEPNNPAARIAVNRRIEQQVVGNLKLHEAWDMLDAMKKLVASDTLGASGVSRVRELLESHPQLVSAMYEIQRRLGIALPQSVEEHYKALEDSIAPLTGAASEGTDDANKKRKREESSAEFMNFGAPDAITDVSSQLAMSKNRAGYGIKRAKGNSAIMNVASGVQDFGIGSSQFPGMDMNSFNFNGMPGGLGAMGSDINTDYSAAYSQSNQQQWGNIGNYSNYSVPDPTNNSYVQNTYSDSDANYFYQQQQQQLLQQQASNEAPARRSRFGTAVPPPIPPPDMPGHIGMESHSGNMSAAANVNSSVDNNSVDAVRQAEEFLRQMMGGNIM